MKDIGGLSTIVTQRAMKLATCWRIIRADGTIFTFTDHDEDLSVGGETYTAPSGFRRSAIASQYDLQPDNLEVVGLLTDTSITQTDLINGLWDHAEVRIFQVDWTSPATGQLRMRRGWIGECTTDDSQRFVAELRGLTQLLSSRIGELYSPECRAELGDERCKIDLPSYQQTGTAGSGSDREHLNSSGVVGAADYFTGGVVTMTSGLNTGAKREVLAYDGTNIQTFLPFAYVISPGDTFTIVPGCDKKLETCKTKFDNVVNFRGEPYVPGQDAFLDYAIPSSSS